MKTISQTYNVKNCNTGFIMKVMQLFLILLFVVVSGCNGGGSNQGSAQPSTNKAITSFSLNGTPGTITGNNIAVTVPYGTSVTALIATFTTTGQSVKVAGVNQVSGTTPNNFTNPVTYTVTAADSSTQNYIVTVTIASQSSKAITAFSLNGTPGTITGTNIAVTVPYGTSVTTLIATYTATATNVKIESTAQVSGTTPNNFTNPVTYTVTAADGSTQNYIVTVTIASQGSKVITAFSLNGTPGTITGNNIAVTVPYGTSVTALIATFTTTGQSVKVGGITQISAATPNNFTNPVTYTVTAADGSTQNYSVTVTIAGQSAKAITAFSINGASGTITGSNIAITVPYVISVNELIATFTTTGQGVKVAGVNQVSGTTPNNFTNPVTYTVTAADGSTQNYTVTLTVAPAVITYITNQGSNSITKCFINESGAFYNCMDSGATGIFSPSEISVDGSYAYILRTAESQVTSCQIIPESYSLGNCVNSGTSVVSNVINVAFSIYQGKAYFVTETTGGLFANTCVVNTATGMLDGCASAGSEFDFYIPAAIALNTGAGGATILYFLQGENGVIENCPVTNGQVFSNCDNGHTTPMISGRGMAINTTSNIAYITGINDANDGIVAACNINESGLISSCGSTAAATGFNNVAGIAIGNTGTYTYVVNTGNNTVSQCTNSGTTLTNCVNSGANGLSSPSGIVIFQ